MGSVSLLCYGLLAQLFSQALCFLDFGAELDDLALLLTVEIEEELEWDLDVPSTAPAIIIVESVDDLL